jgi:regulatory protein SWI6
LICRVPFEIGIEFCRKYVVEEILRPLLEFDATSSGELHQTPTKEEANAAKRKQMYSGITSNSNGRQYSQDTNLLGYSGSNRFGPPLPVPSPTPSQPSQHSGYNREKQYVPAHWGNPAGQYEPPTKRHRYIEQDPNPSFKVENSQDMDDSQQFSQNFTPVLPLHPQETKNYNLSKDLMINLFLEHDTPNATSTKALMEARSTDIEMDAVIDEYSHTALHWAAALARIPTVEILTRKGANPRRVNDSGETPLIRAVLVTNNHDNQSFSRLLESLHPAIPIADNNGRTILHHIAVTAGVKGRSAAARYYLECLLEFIARGKGSVSLTYFRNHVLDAQDQYGDTALNIAARVGNKSLVDQLQELSADAYLPNKLGLRAIDFDIGKQVSVTTPARPPPNSATASAANQKSKDIIQGTLPPRGSVVDVLEMRTLLDSLNNDFSTEIQQKQVFLDEAHAKLKDKTRELRDTRRKLHLLKEQTTTFEDLQKKSKNLDRAIQEEETRFFNQEKNGTINGDAMNFAGPFDADAPMIVKPIGADGAVDTTPLPPTAILRARVLAYKKNNAALKNHVDGLLYQNTLTEDKIKLVVSKCAGVPLENLDMLLEALLQAVDSDGPQLDQNELREFLNRIPRVS